MGTSRRNFIKTTSLASLTLSPVVSYLSKSLNISDADAEKQISFQCHLFRPKDLLDFEFSFLGAKQNNNVFNKIKFLKPIGKSDSYMIVRIAQQHISELFFYLDQNHYDTDFISNVKDAIAKSFISGFSFLVFKVHFNIIRDELKFNSDNLLYWNADYFELMTGEQVSTRIINPNYPLVKDGFPFLKNVNVPITTFELPYKLYLTPFQDKFIFGSNKIKEKGSTVELWWNQIQSPLRKNNYPSFKVIGYENNNADYTGSEKYLPTEGDREKLTKQFLKPRIDKPEDEAETLDFRITPLGAITKIRYNQDDKNYEVAESPIIEWKQDINLGRDNYIKVVTLGVIMPFGFKCKHIRIGERKIRDGVSFVEYKEFIEPLEFEKSCFLSENPAHPNEPGTPRKVIEKGDKLETEQRRNTPFKTIKITTKISPPIIPVDDLTNEVIVDFIVKTKDDRYTADPEQDTAAFKGRRGAFWAKVKNDVKAGASPIEELLHFNYVGIDWNNNEIHFKAPFIFARDILFNGIKDAAGKGLIDVSAEYIKAENKVRREIDVAGQKIAYYKSEILRDIGEAIHNSKLSELETNTIQFIAYQGEKFLNEFPYYPQLEAAYVNLPVVKEIIKDPRGTIIKYAGVYLDKGIEKLLDDNGNAVNNIEGILLDIQKEAIDAQGKFIGFAAGQVENVFNNVADKLAGVVKPEMVIKAVSLYENAYGTYQQCAEVVDKVKNIKKITSAELQNFKNNIFKEAKLLGTIELKKILSDNLNLDSLPISDFKEVYDTINGLRAIQKIQVTYNWIGGSEIFDGKDFGIVHFYNHNYDTSVKTTVAVNFFQEINLKDSSKSYYKSSTSLNNFGVGIGSPIIILSFDNITFKSATNQKADVDVAISKVEFSGLLELIKQLQDSLGTVGKGLNFDISFEKILIGYSFEVPAISTGAFNLSNIRLGFDFNLYFKHKPIDFWFKFSERESPFVLSVAIYGGRGYFGIRVSSRKIEEVEAMLEFGGYVGIEVGGIARGCVYLMAGIFYRNTSGTTDLYGYVVCGGILNVLGLVEMSMTFYLGMESHGNEGALMGTASVTVKIRLGFFKIERTASMTKRITGNGGTENMVINSYSTYSATPAKTTRLLHHAESADSTVFDECDRPINIPDDCLIEDSLGVNELLEEYSNAFN